MNRIAELDRTEIPVFNPAEGLLPELHQHTLAVSRFKVPGGWIVVISTLLASEEWDGEREYTAKSISTTAVFVADPEHTWLGEDLQEGE